uniref:Uncharacterized protein n=1 Tax=Anguilla anguilla TaxID=7936 RepID=A0A0E9V9Y0_ANGAN
MCLCQPRSAVSSQTSLLLWFSQSL